MVTTRIAGIEIPKLVKEFGTPTFVYDAAKIVERINDLREFPVIRFAQKANSNLAVLSLMRRHGVVVDAVSAGEIHRALLAGYRPDQIVYTADIFDHPALEAVARHKMHVNCGSPDMIRQLAAVLPGASVTLRINPGFGHGHSQKTNTGGEQSKHGIWHEQLRDCLALAREVSVRVTGIHMHIGSGTDFEHLAQVGGALASAALDAGHDLKTVSAGGGLPTPYRPGDRPLDVAAYVRLWKETHRRLEEKLGRTLQLEVEPGRYLVAEAGYLLTEIRAIKKQGNNTFYLLNAGFNNLARPILYGAYHPMSVCPASGSVSESVAEKAVIVGGPLCESGDIFTQSEGGFVEARNLPVANVGDFLTIHCAGAYSFAMSSNYNSMPLAAEVMILDGKPTLVRARQSMDDLVRGEQIPPALA